MTKDVFPGEDELVVDPETLRYVAPEETEEELLGKLPPAGSPVTVVRPVRLPFEVDAMVKALADARGVYMSDLIREWVTAGLATAGATPDPVTEIRTWLGRAQRALDSLDRRPPRDDRTAAA